MVPIKNAYACAFCQESFSVGTFLVQHVEDEHRPLNSFKDKNEKILKKDTKKYQDKSIIKQSKHLLAKKSKRKPLCEDQGDIDNKEKQETGLNTNNKTPNKSANVIKVSKVYDCKDKLGENLMFPKIHEENAIPQIESPKDFTLLNKNAKIFAKKTIYSCKFCTLKFPGPKTLMKHERIHTGEKPYGCKFCDKKFTVAWNRNDHEAIHTGERNYACRFCNEKFGWPQAKRRHEMVHLGEQPHACGFCDKKFTQSTNLKAHEKIHSGEKPFKCRVCDMKFILARLLKDHERIHTGEKPYACSFCGKKFRTTTCRAKHRNLHSKRESKIKSENRTKLPSKPNI